MPKGKLTYRRGEIRWVKLDPTIKQAQKTRAYLIVQSNVINQHGLLTIVMPLLPGQKQAPYTVNVQATAENGLSNQGLESSGT
jgi:mRNA interferase MazF